MMISNDLMESFEWKTEDWGKNRSLILSKSKQALPELEYYITLPISDRGKAVKERQGEANSDRFLDPIYP